MNQYLTALKKYGVFSGRANREDYWMYIGIWFVVLLILAFVSKLDVHNAGWGGALVMIYVLVTLLPSFAVTVRRLHDTNHKGWWAWVPIYGLYLVYTKGTSGANRFGPDTLNDDAGEPAARPSPTTQTRVPAQKQQVPEANRPGPNTLKDDAGESAALPLPATQTRAIAQKVEHPIQHYSPDIKRATPFDFKNASPEALRNEYNRIAEEIGDDQFFTKKELNHLPSILSNMEQVLAFSSGLMDGNTWLIALTDRRIIFLDKGMIYGLKQVSIDLDKVNAISGKTGLLFGKISIQDSAKERLIENVWKKTVIAFTNKARDAIEARKQAFRPYMTAQVAADDIGSKLERLANLLDRGLISRNEFEQQKAKLLA